LKAKPESSISFHLKWIMNLKKRIERIILR